MGAWHLSMSNMATKLCVVQHHSAHLCWVVLLEHTPVLSACFKAGEQMAEKSHIDIYSTKCCQKVQLYYDCQLTTRLFQSFSSPCPLYIIRVVIQDKVAKEIAIVAI